ncbi:3,4-dihydroxy-2-butanone-4-phosphate synthase [Rothia sp. P100]|uniref:3,4-dihydroxy-2-butanone-4-phosphate synthase n=1 Tax=Rothia sp. P100 TaxID=2939578 RepID=UPI0020411856|nr:3,4-dihydroxy-2-butanone-4-phosphate synthase [Rothia sp. P100]MCM3510315.1 3,4-dihydroxy-2-butanone-4-phosphate synthase [Rothia sp. P100]
MFTGIVAATGTVLSLEPVTSASGEVESAVLTVDAGEIISDLAHGGSLAINGVCLTATRTQELGEGVFAADMMGETLARTNLGTLTPGSRVNLERCMPAGGRFDGHVVQGHVDGLGTIARVEDHASWRTLRVHVPRELAGQLAYKGSITISGVSLTITAVSPAGEANPWFEVGLIPATLEATTLGHVQVGDTVNLETDALAKYVQRLLEVSGAVAGLGIDATLPASPETETQTPSALDTIQDAIEQIGRGGAVVVVDDEDRENEGDIIFAAEHATADLMGFTVRYTSGVICAPMSNQRADALNLPPMVQHNEDSKGTAYTLTCDAREGVTTGISAADRARTVQVLAHAASGPADLTRPGHILPLRAVEGGVRQRPGHTEAAVELTQLAGLSGVGVIAELVHDTGHMMRFDALRTFATEHHLPMISIADLVSYLEGQHD